MEENVQEAFPLHDPKGLPLPEALWTKGILDHGCMNVLNRKKYHMVHGMRLTFRRRKHWRTQRKQKFHYAPLISIAVPAYQTPENF